IFKGKQGSRQELRYWQWNRGKPYYTHNAAVRDDDWKLVFPHVSSKTIEQESELQPVLYNLKTDPKEKKDISSEHPDIYEKLKELWKTWSQEVEGDRQKAVFSNK